jgi:alpha,alpha-trehalase
MLEAATRLAVRPERSVVVEDADAGVAAGRSGGFGLVIGVDRTGHADELLRCGADVTVADLADVRVRTGDKPMSALPNALDSYGQLIGVVGGRRLMVFLDFDGTLSDIVSDPGAATLVDGAATALEHLAAHCPVAIVSGRDLADIRSRVGIPGIWYAGSHGFELTGPDGSYHQNDAAVAAVPVLESAADELRDELRHIPGVRVEHKRFAVAVHYRNVAPERIGEIVATTRRLGQRDGLRVSGGRKLVELRPDIDWDKGTTLAWIRDRIDEPGRVLPLYIGDDLTDEDAFDVVRLDGIGVVVTHTEDGDRPTAAHCALDSPHKVREFIERGGSWLGYERARGDPDDGRLLHCPHITRVDTQWCRACVGARPGQPRSGHGVLRPGREVRHRRHPGRHHRRRNSSRRDGRQRRPRATLLHRAGDARRSYRLVAAVAGITWRIGVPDPLPWLPPAPAGQREGRRDQR